MRFFGLFRRKLTGSSRVLSSLVDEHDAFGTAGPEATQRGGRTAGERSNSQPPDLGRGKTTRSSPGTSKVHPDDLGRTAFNLLRAAAEGGYAPAQHVLGLQYLNGAGIPRSMMLAELWLTKAASAGDIAAQFTLGILHWDCHLLGKNIHQATYWLKQAARGGHSRAHGVLAQLTNKNEAVRPTGQDSSHSGKNVAREQLLTPGAGVQHRLPSKDVKAITEQREIIRKVSSSKPSDFAIVGEQITAENEPFFWAGFEAGKQCFEVAERGS